MNFSSDPDITSLVRSDSFIRKVRRTSVTLRDTGLISNEDIREAALLEAYPRIALIIASAKARDGNELRPVLGGIGPGVDYDMQYREVRRVMVDSVYSEGIDRIAAALTASICIKQIPLNSDVQLFDLGKQIEEQALSDLDRIMGLIETVGVPLSKSEEGAPSGALTDLAIYFSESIDLSTIPEAAFSKIKAKSAQINEVRVNPSIWIPEDRVGVCWFYLTGTSLEGSIESAFIVESGSRVEEIVEVLALRINEACIARNSTLLASPNRGDLNRVNLAYRKSELYEVEEGDPDAEKELSFTISTRLHYVQLASRYLSTTLNRELVSVRLYTLPLDMARSVEEAISHRYSPMVYEMEGILYGTKPKYQELDNRGPHSLLIDVEKGAAAADPNQRIGDIDTLYFRVKSGCNPEDVEGRLCVRVSTPSTGDNQQWCIEAKPGTSAEQLALDLLTSLYDRGLHNRMIGSMPHSNALQLIPFMRTEEEVRMVMDVVELPHCIELATGTSLLPMTQYKDMPRSVVVKAQVNQIKDSNSSHMTAPPAASKTAPATKSSRLQAVYDKMDFLKTVERNRWRPM